MENHYLRPNEESVETGWCFKPFICLTKFSVILVCQPKYDKVLKPIGYAQSYILYPSTESVITHTLLSLTQSQLDP